MPRPEPPRKSSEDFRYNRRLYPRYTLVLRVGALHSGESTDPCLVRNISARGIMARVYRKLNLGDEVDIELAPGELLKGAVLWARDWDVGIGFPEEIDVEGLLAQRWVGESAKRTRMPRIELDCPAKLQSRGRFYNVRICDISNGGARVQMQRPLAVGSNLLVTIPDLPPLRGDVRWAEGVMMGVAFHEPLPFQILAEWLQERRERLSIADRPPRGRRPSRTPREARPARRATG